MDYIKLNGCYRSLSEEPSQQTVLDIMKVGPDALSKQLTLIELSLFKAIQREEFASLKWNGKEKNLFAPNIVASTRWFNQTNFWVQKEILKYPQVVKRSEALSFFIKLAKKLVDYNNLYSAMAVVSALQVECIYRLRHTWDGLNSKDRSAYRRLEELFSQDQNCRRQREHMNSISLPGIPYLGVYLSDLTYTNLAHPRIGGKPTAAWNSKINGIIDIIAYFQQSEYAFVLDETINAYLCAQRYIEELQKFIEEDNYRTSLCLEPPPPSVLETSISFYPSPVDSRALTASIAKVARDKSADRSYLNSPSQSKLSSKPVVGSRKYEKIAMDNSSFECDGISSQVTYEDDRSKLLLFNPASTGVGPVQSTPVTRPRFMSDGELGFHNALNSCLCDEETSHDTKQSGLLATGTLSDKQQQMAGSLDPVPNRKLSDITGYTCPGNWAHRSQHDYSQKQLPPIPPRPSGGGGGEMARKPQLCASNKHVEKKGDEPSHGPAPAVSSFEGTEVDSASSVGCLPTSKPAILQNTGTNEPRNISQSTKHPMTPATCDALGDAAVAAVSAAALAKDLTDLRQLEPSVSDGTLRSSVTSNPYDNTSIGLTRSVTPASERPEFLHHRRCASIPVSFLTPLPSPVCHIEVTVVFQGALQRRVAHTSRPHFFSPKCHRNAALTASPSVSLSLSVDRSPANHNSWTLPKPSGGFSSWHRLWATLVLIGTGSTAYMIYFEPKLKNAVLRHEFEAHHCQIQCLVNRSSSCPTSADINSRPGDSVAERDELLGSTVSESDHRSQSLDRRRRLGSSRSSHTGDMTAQVEIGHHHDGTPDPHSFILYDPNGARPCQFRPVDRSPRVHSSRPFAWFRRAVTPHSPRGSKSRSDQTAAAPITDSNARLSEANPGTNTITSTDSSYANDPTYCLPTPEASTEVGQWITALRLVFSQVHRFRGQENFSL